MPAKPKTSKKPRAGDEQTQAEPAAVAVIEPEKDDPGQLKLDEPVVEVVASKGAGDLSDPDELAGAIEALLFTSPDPLSPRKLSRALGNVDVKAVREAVERVRESLDGGRRGIQVIEVAGGYQLATRDRFAPYIQQLGTKKKPPALSGATLETLAVIGYRQPVIRAVVESIRGVESSGTIRNLMDMGLIEIVGRKEVIGRPPMYGTTKKFLRVFGLRNLRDLPSIQGLRERFAEEAAAAAAAREAAQEEAASEAPTGDDLAEAAAGLDVDENGAGGTEEAPADFDTDEVDKAEDAEDLESEDEDEPWDDDDDDDEDDDAESSHAPE